MDDNVHMKISIPSDNEGYVLLKCSYCGTYFKITPHDIEDDGILELYCPSCGLRSSNYLTDDVIKLAQAMYKNIATKMIYDELKKMEKQFSNGIITFKAGAAPAEEPEIPVRSGIEALEITDFPCCNRSAKIKPLLKMTGCYCPFCGVKDFGTEYN